MSENSNVMAMAELAEHLRSAAQAEVFAINIMECVAARHGAGMTAVVKDTRRRAEALGQAYRLILQLEDHPDIALELGRKVAAGLRARPNLAFGLSAAAVTELES